MRIALLIGLVVACSRSDSSEPAPASRPAPPAPAPAPAPKPVADTASSASPVWKPGPKVVAATTVDGAALRAKHRERLAADRSPVTVLTGGTPLALGQR